MNNLLIFDLRKNKVDKQSPSQDYMDVSMCNVVLMCTTYRKNFHTVFWSFDSDLVADEPSFPGLKHFGISCTQLVRIDTYDMLVCLPDISFPVSLPAKSQSETLYCVQWNRMN